jgi:riboflavin kinase/FMN adenylyltransferase
MLVHRAYWNLAAAAHGAVVAIGNFDGVHRGHRALIGEARAVANRLGAPLGVVTFEPHPLQVLRPEAAPPRLTPLRRKAILLEGLGVARLFALTFDQTMRQKSPEGFVHDVLAGGLAVRHVVVGYDFRFGHKAMGDAARLQALGDEYGFGVTTVEPVAWRGEVCSSSRVRKLLLAGEVGAAAELLAAPFTVEGRVVGGARRGRELGYPTANLRPNRPGRAGGTLLWPPAGIYAVRARYEEGGRTLEVDGAASLGVRPTFDDQSELLLEVHLLDGSPDLYGKRLCCAFIERLRDEERFSSVEALKAQMADDCARAREVLENRRPTSHISADGP